MSSRATRVFFVGWLVVQVGVPTVLLFREARPVPFGWQMYSVTSPSLDVTLHWHGDSASTLDFRRIVPRSRGELTYASLLPPHLCARNPELDSVRVRIGSAGEEQVHACR